jgi:hypothetical protein
MHSVMTRATGSTAMVTGLGRGYVEGEWGCRAWVSVCRIVIVLSLCVEFEALGLLRRICIDIARGYSLGADVVAEKRGQTEMRRVCSFLSSQFEAMAFLQAPIQLSALKNYKDVAG